MQTPFGTAGLEPDAAFAGAAARFFELLKSFAAQPQAAPGQAPDWTAFGTTLASQFEQWLRASPAAGAAFATAAGFPAGAFAGSRATWPPGPVPLGPAAASGADEENAWELLMRLGQLQGQLTQHWSEIANSAAQRFMARMRTAGRTDLTAESALALYETWVQCAEEAYGATVRREDFSRLQAQLTNTAMALLLAQRRQAEALARAWGLPTRAEADALQRQIRELRQQLEERAAPPSAGTRQHPQKAPRPKRRPAKAAAGRAGRSRRSGARRGRR
ncbi:MAG: poly(R)-hydroxyalkanoic acid synthase subunit PhaE [Steroidobacteraceae bacterium]